MIESNSDDELSGVKGLEEVAADHDSTPSQVAPDWLVTFHGETVFSIPGASQAQHAEQSAAAMKSGLSMRRWLGSTHLPRYLAPS